MRVPRWDGIVAVSPRASVSMSRDRRDRRSARWHGTGAGLSQVRLSEGQGMKKLNSAARCWITRLMGQKKQCSIVVTLGCRNTNKRKCLVEKPKRKMKMIAGHCHQLVVTAGQRGKPDDGLEPPHLLKPGERG